MIEKLNQAQSPIDMLMQEQVEKLQQTGKDPAKLKEAAEEFEALFVSFMLKTMRKTVMKSGLLESGLGGEIMESLFDQELSRNIAQNSQLGFAETLLRELDTSESVPQLLNFEVPKYRLPAEKQLVPSALGTDKVEQQPAKPVVNKYLDMSINERLAAFSQPIDAASQKFRLDANLIRAVIAAESAGNPYAESRKGAKGLMQLMDPTAESLKVEDSFDPAQNINGGARYLSRLLRSYDGDLELALAGYNAGPGNVRKYGGVPPFKETQGYIERVQRFYRRFSAADE